MFDPISLAAGAALISAGFGLGRIRRARPPEKPAATCGCGHSLAHHDPGSNECHGQTLHKEARDERGKWIGDQWVDCACRQYVGPLPVESLYATPLLPPMDSE